MEALTRGRVDKLSEGLSDPIRDHEIGNPGRWTRTSDKSFGQVHC